MFKVGDKVRIRKELNLSCTEPMKKYAGRETTIASVICDGVYLVEIDGSYWFWIDETLEKVGE